MAALKRGSESTVTVFAVISFVLFVASAGCGIWFYMQLSMASKAIADDQNAFASAVETVFTANNWSLSTQSPTELGVKFDAASYGDVAGKLKEAAEYEKVVLPQLGWQSTQGIKDAMTNSPVQTEMAAKGQPAFNTMSGLLDYYGKSYTTLNQTVADLQNLNTDLAARLDQAQSQLVQTEQDLHQQLSDASAKFTKDLDELRAGYNAVLLKEAEQEKTAAGWQQKYQQEVNAHKAETAQLLAQSASWEKRYNDLLTPPGGEEAWTALGKVVSVDSAYDFVVVQGGKDTGVKENDRFVVYDVTPDGKAKKKGIVLVGQVYDHTSHASIAEEDDLIIPGDYFMSLSRWTELNKKAEARKGS